VTNFGQSTLDMIIKEFQNFPEFRLNFFTLLKSIVEHCFQALFELDNERFKTVVNSIIWAFKHEKPELADIGLNTMIILIQNMSTDQSVLNQFMQTFYMPICQDIFYVMTDTLHKSGFKLQTKILMMLIEIIENNMINVPLSNDTPNNKQYMMQYLCTALGNVFPNLNKIQVETYVISLFNKCNDWDAFKTAVRDLLVSLKEFAFGGDELYTEERETELREARAKEEAKLRAVPGLMTQYDERRESNFI